MLARAPKKAGKAVHGIATHTLAQLEGYDFPGNIRELENIVERAVVLSSGPVLAMDLGLPARAQSRAKKPAVSRTVKPE
jgi:DNA-binding NtrC family response regulator